MRHKACRRRTFVLLVVLLLISRSADAVTTYMVTPDLRSETNPLVTLLGAGWLELIIVQMLLTAMVAVLTYWDLYKSPLPYPSRSDLAFREFAQEYYFGQKRSLLDFVWRPPAGWRLNLKLLGYVLPRVLIMLGFYVSVSSFVSLHIEVWRQFLRETSPWIYYVPAIIYALASIRSFLRREYAFYLGAVR